MKMLWIFVVLLWLLIFPLVWWDSDTRVVTTLSSGVIVDAPQSSQSAFADLDFLLQPEQGITHLYIHYGLARGLYVVYPGTAVLTLTAPWGWEKLRYPLIQRFKRDINNYPFTAVPSVEDIVVDSVQVWVNFIDTKCSVDQLLTVTNTSEQALEQFALTLPARDWLVRSYSGEPLDHANANGSLVVFLEVELAPGGSCRVLITQESEVVRHGSIEWAEAVVIQPAGINVLVNEYSETGIQTFMVYEELAGYWELLLPRPRGSSN